MKITSEIEFGKYLKSNVGKCVLLNSKDTNGDTEYGEILIIDKLKLDEYKKHYNNFFQIVRINRRFKILNLNFNDIYEGKSFWETRLNELQTNNPTQVHEEIYIDLNRRIINFLSSFKTFIDNILYNSTIKKIYGKDSLEASEFTSKQKEWYHKYFAYRFLITLRDYAIHSRLPLQVVDVEGSYEHKRKQKVITMLRIQLNKTSLLKNEKMNRRFKSELALYNVKFPFLPILEQIKPVIKEIYNYCIYLCSREFMTVCNSMESIMNHFVNPNKVSFGTIEREKDRVGPNTSIIDSNLVYETIEIINSYTNTRS